MKKSLILLIITYVVLVSGCKGINKQNNENYENKEIDLVTTIEKQDHQLNKYKSEYFQDDISTMKYEGQFLFKDIHKCDVAINMEILSDEGNSRLFKLYLDPIQDVPKERLIIGHFYEVGDTIYKIMPTKENLEIITSSGNLPKDSIIVCQSEAIPDALDKVESGFHHYIAINDDKIEYHSYNNLVDTGYYESFTWKKDTGLVFYQTGFGAERESIKLKLISVGE